MITSVLVANRGEIARRVFRTCRDLGIATVAVYADPDAEAPHVREADASVRLPGSAPTDTYLRGDLIVKAALAAGADAVHPGYGFLSENADFARAVAAGGLTWIGPPPAAIEAMASKTGAKKLMTEAGVPLLAPLAATDVRASDLPVLVKASAGGGGRGMRVVRELAALEGETEAARAEAASAFGDGEVFIESYVERGRHVEVQVLADAHGQVWALGTRDCSLQRRHQKVIEEAPAPGLPEALHDTLQDAAVAAARAVSYEGAGTVEFLVSEDGRPYFLEMNTRLQVEHPVTECVHGLDLVEQQIRVAEGDPLPPGGPPHAHGHAVEARLYAEDPSRDWQPQTGTLWRLHVPGDVRVDAGFADGSEIGMHYDPMLAKVIAWAPTRDAAVRKLARALERADVHGPLTNRDLLVRSLRHPDFAAARLDTGFYDRHLTPLTAPPADAGTALLVIALADATRPEPGRPAIATRVGGWRNLASAPQVRRYTDTSGTPHEVRYTWTREGPTPVEAPNTRVLSTAPHQVTLELDGVRREFPVAAYGPHRFTGPHAFTALPRLPQPEATHEPGSLLAQMPGTVVRLATPLEPGTPVTAGQPLIWLEAMKMQHQVVAPTTGTLTALHVTPGQQVEVGTVLAVVT
ncbi:acetyl/propionyl/methylcrotonyl-CoA carboxylase subunit alpha [Streptomyces iconiensis]|uniref:Biotin carboxylase N-terminal domain-containing protein n=1 Tax=Streptomyces iconiensis TaxID=1384038 RepID=A0ABT7ABX4_9ACTN|nr:biotin carboxylase N-terminal domain-containing protein [Streptomyces iconiensis]MDJ1138567.1 biotin carboxylase N-terminal domain-containing protein [Streptomyces iconiensis]